MAETTITNIKRSLMRHFINIGTSETPEWALIGNGVSELTVAYNPQSEDHAYIHEDTPTTDLDSYKPSFPVSMVAKKGEPVFDYVDGKRIARAVGEDAKTEILTVYMYKDEISGAYPAEKSNCTIQIDDFGGEGAKNATINYMILLIVLVACRLDIMLGTNYIRDAVCIAFIANETLSIIENAGLMGVPIPSVITKAIDVLKSKSEDTDNN